MRTLVITIGIAWILSISKTLNAQDFSSRQEIRTETAIENLGDILHIALPVTAGLSTLFADDKKSKWQFAKSMGTTLAITYAVKYAINKPRPDGATDGHAFPSGHTSVSFQSASFIQRKYGWEYGIPAYAIAGFVAYSRLEGLNDRHDGWDVFAGAIVGVGSTYLFTKDPRDYKIDLTYSSGQGVHTVGVVIKF